MKSSFRPVFPRRAAKLFATLGITGLLLTACPDAYADDWQPSISDTALPARVVAVDKRQQTFHLYEKKSPLTLKFSYPCTTGQVDGDKQVINDLRTPEGVYFVEYKIANGLDFKEYGGIAYTLNYPNPVDKLRGKTGHGIWIHSKGFGIVPKDTRGCIAIGLPQIDQVGPLLTPGTAVVVGERIATEKIPHRDDGTIRHLRMRMDQWTRAWASRSDRLFDFYDAESYTKAMPESFTAFKANKERLFKRFAWINIFNREVHVLEGPGYWVTWSEQFYRAPNLSTEGIRRLYWQKDKSNNFRIVGMEWTPRNLGMQADYQKGQLVASAEAPATDASPEAPLPPPLSMPESAENSDAAKPAPALSPGTPVAGVPQTPVTRTVPPVSSVPPVPVVSAEAIEMQPDPTPRPGARVPGLIAQTDRPLAARPAPVPSAPPVPQPEPPVQPKLAALLEAPVQPEPVTQLKPAVLPESIAQPEPAPAPDPTPVLDTATVRMLQQKVEAWRVAWQQRSPVFFDFYDQTRYGTLKDIPYKDNFRALKADMTRRFRAPWIELIQRPIRMEVQGMSIVTSCEQLLRVPGQPAVQGIRRLYWQIQPDNDYRIVASHWEQRDVGMQADYLELITTSVTETLEAWRVAWEAGNVDAYMDFYADNARQQGKGKAAIREHKERIWSKTPPEQVHLSGVRVQVNAQGVRADMMQTYKDNTGRGDKGTKLVLLQPHSGGWRIVQEEWAALPLGGN